VYKLNKNSSKLDDSIEKYTEANFKIIFVLNIVY